MLNLTYYEIKAKYTPTNRFRKITILAHSEQEALAMLNTPQYADYTEVKSIAPILEEAPSQRQIEFAKSLGIEIKEDYCKKDLTALISRKLEDPSAPNPGLIDFADEHQIRFSKFIGKKRLYDLVFLQLNTVDKIAFFIFSVYRYFSNNREANLNKSEYRDLFLNKAREWCTEANIINSLQSNYKGSDLRFFGTITLPDGIQAEGGNRYTLIYKKTIRFLKDQGLITDPQKGSRALQAKIQAAAPQPVPQPTPAVVSAPVAPPVEATPAEEPPEESVKKSPMKTILILVGIAIILFLLF